MLDTEKPTATIMGISVTEHPKGLTFRVEDPAVLPTAEEVRDDRAYAFLDLVEDFRMNGTFEEVRPEEVGALTGCPYIFASRIARDDQHNLLDVGDVFWLPSYALVDPAKKLLQEGEVTFQRDPEGRDRHLRLQELVNRINRATGREFRLDYRLRGFPVRVVDTAGNVVQEFEDVIRWNESQGEIQHANLNAERRLLDWLEGAVWALKAEASELPDTGWIV